jgi:hypothetical protein
LSKKLIFKNNANTTIASVVAPTDTTIQVVDVTAFPDPASNGYYYLAIQSLSSGSSEFVEVIAKTGPALTVVRGVDNSIPLAFAIGDYIGMRVIAAQFNDIITRISEPENIQVQTPGPTYTPDLGLSFNIDIYDINVGLTINNPSGTPANFDRLVFRLRTTGSQHALAFGTKYRNSTSYIPTVIPASNSITVIFEYNITLDIWECIGDDVAANAYTDVKVAQALATAEGYTDTQVAATLATAEGYTDTQVTSARGYTDTQVAAARGYTDTQVAATLATAEGYTDTKAASTLATAEGYTDTQTAATLATAKGYTDTQISQANSTALAFSVALG